MPSLHILLVEDHGASDHALASLLRKHGYTVTVAETSGEAIEAAKAEQFDLALIDIKLPDGDGWKLLARLRILVPGLPAIAVTAHGFDADQHDSVTVHFSAHLTKPVAFSSLIREMERVAPFRRG